MSDLSYKKALKLSIFELEKQKIGYGKVNYRLRDARFWFFVIVSFPEKLSSLYLNPIS